MRKMSFLLPVAAVGLAVFFNACVPVGTPPSMTVNPSESATGKPGDVFDYEAIVSSDSDLKMVEMVASKGTTILYTADSTFPAGVQAAIVDFSFTVPNTVAAGDVITLDFTASNIDGDKVVTTTITVLPGDIHTYTAVIISDIENPDGSSFYSLEDNQLMSINQAELASATVDLIYYYGATNQATLCSPADEEVRAFTGSGGAIIVDRLATKNDTRIAMVDITVAEFEAIADDLTILAKTPATTQTAAPNLAKDKVIWCETVTAKKALVLVKNITGTQGTSYITIEVKVQQ